MKKNLFTLLAAFSLIFGLNAQDSSIAGIVFGENGPVSNTEVYLFNSQTGSTPTDTVASTVTDQIGSFELSYTAFNLTDIFGIGTAACPENTSYFFNDGPDSLVVVLTCDIDSSLFEDLFIAASPIDFNGTDWFFTSSAFGQVNSYNWQIEDQTYNTPSVIHSFIEGGEQEVTLTAQMASGAELTASTTVLVFDTLYCQSLFFPLSDSSSASGVVFVNASVGIDLEYFWDFGNGMTSTEAYPVQEFDFEEGIEYEICLTVSSADCEDTFCLTLSEEGIFNWTGGGIFGGRPGNDGEQNSDVGRSTTFEFVVVPMESAPLSTSDNAIDIEIGLFPNPSNGNFSLNMNAENSDLGVISIFDLSGKAVYQKVAQLGQGNNVFNLSLNELPQGVYIISYNGAMNVGTRKLVIQR